jgi:hypothetical protein
MNTDSVPVSLPVPAPPVRKRSVFRWILLLAGGAITLGILALVGMGAFGMDWFVKRAITEQLRQSGVAEVEIGSLDIGLIRPRLVLKNVKLFAEPQLGGVQILDLPELFISYDRNALQRSELHLNEVRIQLTELALIDGIEEKPINMMQMVQLLPMQMAAYTNRLASLTNQVDFEKAQQLGKLKFAGVDHLELTVGRVRFIDMKDPTAERVSSLSIHKKSWSNLKTVPDLVPIAVDLVVRAAVGAQPVKK